MEQIIKSFFKKDFYPHPVKYIEKKETHTSWVFLTGDFAYKIKKPVNFGFLDFSTLKKRRYYCLRELKLNKEFSPSIYLDIVKIKNDNGRINFSKGRIVEYAVKMKEIPQQSIMKNLIKENKVSLQDIYNLAKVIVSAHQKAKQNKKIEKYGKIKTIRFNWEENFSQTKPYIGRTINENTFYLIKDGITSFMEENKKIFLKRLVEKRIKLCHGDLHTGNIFIYKNTPYLFDRIEFNLRFACSDVAADIAFLLMDLEFQGKKYFSDFLLSVYLDKTGDYELLTLLDFYKCYRAYVRGKVEGFLFSETMEEKIKKEAELYFALAKKYIESVKKEPRIVIVAGLPGTGKSTVGEIIAETINGVMLRSDVERRKLFGLRLDTHFYRGFGEDIYSPENTKKVYASLHETADNLLRYGKSVVIDATYSNKNYLEKIKELAEKNNVKLEVFICTAKEDDIRERLKKENRESVSDATWEIYLAMKKRYIPPRGKIINTSSDVKEVKKRLKKVLKR